MRPPSSFNGDRGNPVERHLYWLLAHRLEIDEAELPGLQYFPLAKLALGGEQYKRSLVGVLALNDLRNEFSHEVDDLRIELRFATFCNKVGIFWPESVYGIDAAALRSLRETSVKVAAFTCIVKTWAHIAHFSLQKGLYPSEAEADLARRALEQFERQAEHLNAQQLAARNTWNDLPKE